VRFIQRCIDAARQGWMAFRKLCSRVNFSSRDAYQFIQAEAASRLGLIQALDLTTTMAEPADPEIQRLERAWMTAWVERDRLTCERILADDFVLTSARGILMPKSDWLAAAMTSFVCRPLLGRICWSGISGTLPLSMGDPGSKLLFPVKTGAGCFWLRTCG